MTHKESERNTMNEIVLYEIDNDTQEWVKLPSVYDIREAINWVNQDRMYRLYYYVDHDPIGAKKW